MLIGCRDIQRHWGGGGVGLAHSHVHNIDIVVSKSVGRAVHFYLLLSLGDLFLRKKHWLNDETARVCVRKIVTGILGEHHLAAHIKLSCDMCIVSV